MFAQIKEWFGFEGLNHSHSHGHGAHAHGEGGHGHTHGVIDPSISSSERGIWAIKWSFVILAITAALQMVVVLTSGSVALLADTIHNIADATTAIPLWIAFVLVRRKPTATFNYGLGRVEDLAGMLIVLIVLFSALVAGYEAINRLIHPQPITQLGAVAIAGVIGFVGNEVVAVFRIKVGREMNSAALIADGYHARTDGLTSLAVVAGAFGVWLGFPLADPIIGLAITLAILGIVWQSARAVVTRSLDGIEPGVIEEIRHAAAHVPDIRQIVEAKARWLGHRLHVDVVADIGGALTVAQANAIASALRAEMEDHLPALASATIQWADDGSAPPAPPHAHHHAPEPFEVSSDFASGRLAIIDTAAGERMRLEIDSPVQDLEVLVRIFRPGGAVESLQLRPGPGVDLAFTSDCAPAEPHAFKAELDLTAQGRTVTLPFEMQEPDDHHH